MVIWESINVNLVVMTLLRVWAWDGCAGGYFVCGDCRGQPPVPWFALVPTAEEGRGRRRPPPHQNEHVVAGTTAVPGSVALL